MKLLVVLASLLALAVALDTDADGARGRRRQGKKTTRPKRFTGDASRARMTPARRPERAPREYTVGTGKPTVKHSKANLKKLPSEFIDLRKLRARQGDADFYECTSTVCLFFSSLYMTGRPAFLWGASPPNPPCLAALEVAVAERS